MSTYILVHGAWHGGWCWDKVVPLLAQAGHKVEAPDLPGHGDDETPLAEVSLPAYAARVCQVVNRQAEPVILVGHSMGGLAITQAAEECPGNIQRLVYLTAYLLQNGEAARQYTAQDSASLVTQYLVVAEDKSYLTVREEGLKPAFYTNCTDEDIAWAKSRFVLQASAPFRTPIRTSAERFGRIPRAYIECRQDKTISPAIQKQMYTNLPCQPVISMDADHAPFFSAPEALAGHLHSLRNL